MKRSLRLVSVERLRARALRERRLELGAAARACREAHDRVNRLEIQERESRAALRRELGSPGGALIWGDLADAVRAERGRAEEKLAEARQAEALAMHRVVEARQQLRVVERLRERRAEEESLEERRAEERELNDRNAGRHARRIVERAA